MRRLIALIVGLFCVFLAACAAPASTPAVQIRDPWVRAAVTTGAANDHGMAMDHGGGGNSAAYLTIVGGQADHLLSVTTDIATTAEIHETQIDGNVMRMRPLPNGLEIPAGGRVELQPGGYHIMLMGLSRDLNDGEQVILTLNFERAGAVEVQAPVRMP